MSLDTPNVYMFEGKSLSRRQLDATIEQREVLDVQNIVQNPDGTITRLPYALFSKKQGWWYFDGQIYYQKPPPPIKQKSL